MPFVQRQISCVRWRIGFVEGAILPKDLLETRIGCSRSGEVAEHATIVLRLHRIMQNHRGNGPDLRFHPRAVIGLALLQHRAGGEDELASASGILVGGRYCASMSLAVAAENSSLKLRLIQSASSSAVRRRVLGPCAEIETGIGSLIFISPVSGFMNPTLRDLPSIRISGVSPRNMAVTARMYSRISDTL